MGEQEADVHRPAVEAFLDEEGLGPGV
jgi:hypothetical protein